VPFFLEPTVGEEQLLFRGSNLCKSSAGPLTSELLLERVVRVGTASNLLV
jgi:hypothetical protein